MDLENLEILLSCMSADDEIVSRSKITSNVLIVDQCNVNTYEEHTNGNQTIRIFRVTERGLTRSRNYAIRHSTADICLLCDDDEIFRSNYYDGIIKAYSELPDADVILFDIGNQPTHMPKSVKIPNFRDLMSIFSWQISFRRKSLIQNGIFFDENMGAGTPNGAEEELKFLTDCRKAKLKIYIYPFVIADVAQQESTWFTGFDEKFFINRGNTTRYIMGLFPSLLYAVYYCIRKRGKIKKYMSSFRAFRLTCKGISENRLTKLKRESNEKNT